MAKDEDIVQPDGSIPQKPSLAQTLFAALAGVLAVKIVTYMVVTMWRLVTREDPPDLEQEIPVAKKAAWLALIAASTGVARQLVRDAIKPPTSGAA
jgi:hypothetical protein